MSIGRRGPSDLSMPCYAANIVACAAGAVETFPVRLGRHGPMYLSRDLVMQLGNDTLLVAATSLEVC